MSKGVGEQREPSYFGNFKGLRWIGEGSTDFERRLTYTDRSANSDCLAAETVASLKKYIDARARRVDLFDTQIFSDPAWDLLLWIFLGHLEQRALTISELPVFPDVPPSTATRWLRVLIEEGWVLTTENAAGSNSTSVALSPRATDALNEYFKILGRGTPGL